MDQLEPVQLNSSNQPSQINKKIGGQMQSRDYSAEAAGAGLAFAIFAG